MNGDGKVFPVTRKVDYKGQKIKTDIEPGKLAFRVFCFDKIKSFGAGLSSIPPHLDFTGQSLHGYCTIDSFFFGKGYVVRCPGTLLVIF